LIVSALERVERGEIDRLLVDMPPRHGKSELVSKRFAAYCLGLNPRRQIIAASYNSDLARDFGRSVRNIVHSQRYSRLFETRLAVDSKAADRWNTHVDGAYVAAGVGTAITGRGADILIIDDPLKDREEAESETTRNKVWDWYTSTAYTRLMPGGAVIVVQTRWHEDDLTGRLLEQEQKGGDRWEKLVLPAINEDGEALWKERYPIKALERIKAAIGPRDWSALYQQSPSPADGDFFRRDWFDLYQPDDLPTKLNYYGTSDYAVTADDGDYTVHGVWGLYQDHIWLVDAWFEKTTSDRWIEANLDLVKRYNPLAFFGEGGVIQKAVEPMLRKRMREREAYCRLEWVSSIHDKPTRARGFQARASMGLVHLPDNEIGHWFLDQLLKFPNGKNDDAVDVCSLMGRVIDQAHPAIVKANAPTKPRRDRYDRPSEDSGSWKTV